MNKGKILGIDYGTVRTGLAITDELQIIASPLQTVETKRAIETIEQLIKKEKIIAIVVGEARHLNQQTSEITVIQDKFCKTLANKFPEIAIHRINEMYTSKMAAQSMLVSGMKKSDRAKKENLDMMSAAIILQSYLDSPR
jgi:putative holliday junction resolvase